MSVLSNDGDPVEVVLVVDINEKIFAGVTFVVCGRQVSNASCFTTYKTLVVTESMVV